mmetsp:Transcript_6758/g.20046  ORF Transcript_6758/g.20046 Transcript_6758/m.20046 type:complete len:103 (-) Transcript_6758:33-341(-)
MRVRYRRGEKEKKDLATPPTFFRRGTRHGWGDGITMGRRLRPPAPPRPPIRLTVRMHRKGKASSSREREVVSPIKEGEGNTFKEIYVCANSQQIRYEVKHTM